MCKGHPRGKQDARARCSRLFPKLPTQTPTWLASALEQQAEACPKGKMGTQSLKGVRFGKEESPQDWPRANIWERKRGGGGWGGAHILARAFYSTLLSWDQSRTSPLALLKDSASPHSQSSYGSSTYLISRYLAFPPAASRRP